MAYSTDRRNCACWQVECSAGNQCPAVQRVLLLKEAYQGEEFLPYPALPIAENLVVHFRVPHRRH